jgi:hypothetical protein
VSVCVFGVCGVCVSVNSQHRHVKCYKIRRELRSTFCLTLYHRKTCEDQEGQIFRYN